MLRLMRVIPISTNDRPKAIADSLQQARDAVQSGELVCIFADGGVDPAPGICCRFSAALN